MRTFFATLMLVLLLSWLSNIYGADGFESVRCGEEYATLEDKNFMRDVIKIPKHSKETPEFVGSCQLNGKDLPGVVVGVLKNEEGAAKLPASKVWKIDEKQKKFVELPTEGLRCGPDGISTEDTEH